MTTDDSLEARARRRVRSKLAFYQHALVYVVVNAGLWILNAVTGGPWWAVWPLLGWGIGLAAHGMATFARLRGEGLHERMIAQEVERLKDRSTR